MMKPIPASPLDEDAASPDSWEATYTDIDRDGLLEVKFVNSSSKKDVDVKIQTFSPEVAYFAK